VVYRKKKGLRRLTSALNGAVMRAEVRKYEKGKTHDAMSRKGVRTVSQPVFLSCDHQRAERKVRRPYSVGMQVPRLRKEEEKERSHTDASHFGIKTLRM